MFLRTEFQRAVAPRAWLLKTALFAGLSLLAIQPLAAQSECDSACNQFISTTDSTIGSFMTSLAAAPSHTLVMGGNLFYSIGSIVDGMSPSQAPAFQTFLLNYIDGMKAAGAQRLDLNPGVTSINDPATTALYDAVVQHMRALGLQLAINPEVDTADVKVLTSFQDFQTTAMTTYPALAQRYHPDIFVIVHEPTTQDARLKVTPTTAEWHNFVIALSVAIKAVSPHTRVGTGGFHRSPENTFFQDLATIPNCSASTVTTGCTDFMTMDIYDDNMFTQLDGWIPLAKQKGKGIYIEETWAPKYLPAPCLRDGRATRAAWMPIHWSGPVTPFSCKRTWTGCKPWRNGLLLTDWKQLRRSPPPRSFIMETPYQRRRYPGPLHPGAPTGRQRRAVAHHHWQGLRHTRQSERD